jgi:hypothetical protein
VYGARGDERYAAVWVKRAGADWSAVHGVDGAGYQAAFDNAVAAGSRPVLLAATGPANNPVFAGTFEKRPGPVPLTRFGLVRGADTDSSTIDHWIAQSRSNGWMPASIAIYGSAPDLRYAGIWVDNPQGICWNMEGLADTAASYQSRFDALVPAWARVFQAAVSPDDLYASIFRDDLIGDWIARHELSSSGSQQAFDQFVPQGFSPVSLQAGGAGRAARGLRKDRSGTRSVLGSTDRARGQRGDRRRHSPSDGASSHPRWSSGARTRRSAHLRPRVHAVGARLSPGPAHHELPTSKRQQDDCRTRHPQTNPGRATHPRDAGSKRAVAHATRR